MVATETIREERRLRTGARTGGRLWRPQSHRSSTPQPPVARALFEVRSSNSKASALPIAPSQNIL
eukprot:6196268-Pleurochrysis_carterae.AAC.1